MMSTADQAASSSASVNINGHDVSLLSLTKDYARQNFSQTDWIIVKFNRSVSYGFRQELRQRINLEVYENLGDNTYLCKYKPDNLAPMTDISAITHLAAYPDYAKLETDVLDLTRDTTASNRQHASEPATTGPGNLHDKMPFILALQPHPNQTPQQVLTTVENGYGAERLDNSIVGDTIRVKLDPAVVQDVARVDSIRTIAFVQQLAPDSIHQRTIMDFSPTAANSEYKGAGEIIHVADTGFDLGLSDDVHPAFSGRVLATVTGPNATCASDRRGHGTHVAGSALGNLLPYPYTDLFNTQGTAPESKLVSIALDFDHPDSFPVEQLLTQDVPPYGPPVIMNNSWGPRWQPLNSQRRYGNTDAFIVDKVMYQNPEACFVFTSGNNGCEAPSGKQQQIGGYAAAKNCITVGASYSDRPLDTREGHYSADGQLHSASEMTSFSSQGPTTDFFLGVDVVAPGCAILSARSRAMSPSYLQDYLLKGGHPDSDDLVFMSGTSMATGSVTGCIAVLRSAFRAQTRQNPTGALLKALVIHGAVDLVGTWFKVQSRKYITAPICSKDYRMTAAPNPFQGYGRVNINNSLFPIVGDISGERGFRDSDMTNGKHCIFEMRVPVQAKELTVTLVYPDEPGAKLQIQMTLSVKLSNGTYLSPLKATDPMGRPIPFVPSNVAKIVCKDPVEGPAMICLDVTSSLVPIVKYAVVWTVV